MVLIKLERKHVLQKDFEGRINYFSPCSAKPFCTIHFGRLHCLNAIVKAWVHRDGFTAITYELTFFLDLSLVGI